MATPDAADAAPSTASYADVVERLFAEFDGRHSLATIVDVVHQCRAELEGDVAPGALDESWERSARERLQDWARTWQPVIGDLTTRPGGVASYARHHPANDRIEDAIHTYAEQRTRAELPQHVATIRSAETARREIAVVAAQAHTRTERRLTERALARNAAAGFRATSSDVPRLTAQLEETRDRLDAATKSFDRLTRHPVLASQPGAFTDQLVTGWRTDRDTEQAGQRCDPTPGRPETEEASRQRVQHAHRHGAPAPGVDRGGPSIGR